MTKLFIDTRDSARIVARVEKDGQIYEEVSEGERRRPQSIVVVINKVCDKAKITIHDIGEIHVEEGPGSYTGIKVGVSVANALSFSTQKKVNGVPFGRLIEPKYD